MFEIKPSSDRVKRMIVYPNTGNRPSMPPNVGKAYKLGLMLPGQSIYVRRSEFENFEVIIKRIQSMVSSFNKRYRVFFTILKHSDCHEVARLL